MMIMGGGILSWLQGSVSEVIGIQNSYIVGFMFCLFGFLLGRSVVFLKNQGEFR
jgi:FHS family L-fucose permease-like MFS transporter